MIGMLSNQKHLNHVKRDRNIVRETLGEHLHLSYEYILGNDCSVINDSRSSMDKRITFMSATMKHESKDWM